MKSHAIWAAVVGCSLILLSGNAFACGESLFRVGKGVSFREYTAPLPGSILVVARTEAELAMVSRLAAAGHDITVVPDASQIGAEFETGQFDIVLAYYSDKTKVESQMSSSSATFIPVALSGTEEESEAARTYRRSLANDDSVLKYLKTIHGSLKDNA